MREVLSVREREREIQTERDGSDVTIVALKLAMNFHFPLPKIRTIGDELTLSLAGLEKSAAIRPFATKKSRLASETFLLADSLATETCRLADRLATKTFFQGGQRRCICGLNGIAQGAWRSLLVQDAWELAVRTPSIVFASKSTPGV